MAWNNGPLVLYHGCDDVSAANINKNGVQLTKCKRLADFGHGFYTTTNLGQAKNWANRNCQLLLRSGKAAVATVIRFDVDRDKLANLDFLGFVSENSNPDFWNFVRTCRQSQPPRQHRRSGNAYYDVVFGPVSLWPQTLVIKDCDQISFHTSQGITCLGASRTEMQPTSEQPLFL